MIVIDYKQNKELSSVGSEKICKKFSLLLIPLLCYEEMKKNIIELMTKKKTHFSS